MANFWEVAPLGWEDKARLEEERRKRRWPVVPSAGVTRKFIGPQFGPYAERALPFGAPQRPQPSAAQAFQNRTLSLTQAPETLGPARLTSTPIPSEFLTRETPNVAPFVADYFAKRGWNTSYKSVIFAKPSDTQRLMQEYNQHMNEAANAYRVQYGDSPFLRSGLSEIAKYGFPATAKLISPAKEPITTSDVLWDIAGLGILGMGTAVKTGATPLVRGAIELATGGAVAGAAGIPTVQNWPESSLPEKALGVGFTGLGALGMGMAGRALAPEVARVVGPRVAQAGRATAQAARVAAEAPAMAMMGALPGKAGGVGKRVGQWDVTIRQKVKLQGRTTEEALDRVFTVNAQTRAQAIKAVKDAGHSGEIQQVTKRIAAEAPAMMMTGALPGKAGEAISRTILEAKLAKLQTPGGKLTKAREASIRAIKQQLAEMDAKVTRAKPVPKVKGPTAEEQAVSDVKEMYYASKSKDELEWAVEDEIKRLSLELRARAAPFHAGLKSQPGTRGVTTEDLNTRLNTFNQFKETLPETDMPIRMQPGTAGQIGMGIGEQPAQGQLMSNVIGAGQKAPLADVEQIALRQARQAQITQGQAEMLPPAAETAMPPVAAAAKEPAEQALLAHLMKVTTQRESSELFLRKTFGDSAYESLHQQGFISRTAHPSPSKNITAITVTGRKALGTAPETKAVTPAAKLSQTQLDAALRKFEANLLLKDKQQLVAKGKETFVKERLGELEEEIKAIGFRLDKASTRRTLELEFDKLAAETAVPPAAARGAGAPVDIGAKYKALSVTERANIQIQLEAMSNDLSQLRRNAVRLKGSAQSSQAEMHQYLDDLTTFYKKWLPDRYKGELREARVLFIGGNYKDFVIEAETLMSGGHIKVDSLRKLLQATPPVESIPVTPAILPDETLVRELPTFTSWEYRMGSLPFPQTVGQVRKLFKVPINNVEELRELGFAPFAPKPAAEVAKAVPVAKVVPTAGKLAEAIKEPWMMTQGEYLRSIGYRGTGSSATGRYLKGISMQKYTRGQKFHKRIVEQSLSDGKPVPPEVLADYPDLLAKAPVAAVPDEWWSKGKVPEALESGLSRVRYEKGRFIYDIYGSMSQAQRKAIDEWLVSIKHPSVFEAGTSENRIVRVAQEIVEKREAVPDLMARAPAAAVPVAKVVPPAARAPVAPEVAIPKAEAKPRVVFDPEEGFATSGEAEYFYGPTVMAQRYAAAAAAKLEAAKAVPLAAARGAGAPRIPPGPFKAGAPYPRPQPVKAPVVEAPVPPAGPPPVEIPPAGRAMPPVSAEPLLTIPSTATILAQRLAPNRLRFLGQALDIPVLKQVVQAINPSALIKSVPQRAKFVHQIIRSELTNRKVPFLAQLTDIKPGYVREANGIVQGATPKLQGLSVHELDIVQSPHRYNLSPEAQRYFEEAQRLSEQLTMLAMDNGIPLNTLQVETGTSIFHRMVKGVRGVEKAGAGGARPSVGAKQGIQKPRVYATAAEGVEHGVEYGNIMESLAEKYEQVSKLVADKRLAEMLNPLGRIPKAPFETRQASAQAIIAYRQTRQAERVIEGAFHGERQLTQTINRVAEVDPVLGKQFKEAMAIKAPEAREAALAPLVIDAKNLTTGRKFVADKARGEVKRALELSRQPRIEPAEGRIVSPFANNRIFPKEIADETNKLLDDRVNGILRAMAAVSAVPRFMGTTFDFGIMTLQLQTAMGNPKLWGKAMEKMFEVAFRPKIEARYYAANMELYRRAAKSGRMLSMTGTEFTEAARSGGILSKIPGVRKVTRPFVRAFDFPGNYVRTEMLKLDINAAEKAGKVAETVAAIDHITGRMGELGLSATRKTTESALFFFSPHYTKSIAATLADIAKGGQPAKQSLKRLVSAAAIGATAISIARKANGQNIRDGLVPDNAEFGSVKIHGTNIGIGGAYRAVLLAGGMIEKAIQNGEAERVPDLMARFLRGRSAPAVSMAWDLYTERTYIGQPLETWQQRGLWATSQMVPFSWRDYAAGDTPDMWWQPAAALGLRVYPETTTQKWNTLAEEAYGKGAKFYDLPPREQALLRNSPDGFQISKTQKMNREQRAIRTLKEQQYQQQQERDNYLGQGWRPSSIDGQMLPYGPKEWRGDYDRAQVESAAHSDFREKALTIAWKEAKTEERKALEGYYELQDKFVDPRSNLVDFDAMMEARDTYLNSLSSDLQFYVQEQTHPNRTPVVEEYLKAKRQLRSYWEIQDDIANDPSWTLRGQTFQQISDLYERLTNQVRSQPGTPEGEKAMLAAKSLMAHPAVKARASYINRQRLLWRLENPETEALMIKWGYVTTPAAQQTGTTQQRVLIPAGR